MPLIEVHYGHFVTRNVRLPLASPPASGPRSAEVVRTEEKGSDVNLATYLLRDAFTNNCDTAVVVSNDSDLAEAVHVARTDAGIRVGVVNPHPAKYRSRKLQGTFFKQLRQSALAQSQFPPVLSDNKGVFRKPSAW